MNLNGSNQHWLFIFLDYGFEELINTDCRKGIAETADTFDNFEDAKKACIKIDACKAIVTQNCSSNHRNFSLCNKDQQLTVDMNSGSCVYMKYTKSKTLISYFVATVFY